MDISFSNTLNGAQSSVFLMHMTDNANALVSFLYLKCHDYLGVIYFGSFMVE